MATTPQGDDPDVRSSVTQALARAVARQRMATSIAGAGRVRPKKLSVTYTSPSVRPMAVRR